MRYVKDLMTKNPKTCQIDASITCALDIMKHENVGSVPVVDIEGRLESIITDRDITLALREHLESRVGELTVRNCLQQNHSIITISPDDDVDNAIALMEEYQVRRLPVRDNTFKCIGIVSQADIALNNPKEKQTAKLVQAISQ